MDITLYITVVLALALGVVYVFSKREESKKTQAILIEKNTQLAKDIEELKKERDRLLNEKDTLSADNQTLQKERLLSAANEEIKDSYILKLLCNNKAYLDFMEDRRKSLLKYAMANTATDIVCRLKNDETMKTEEEKFYHTFDLLFLKMHPDFIDHFNELFDEKDRIDYKKNEQLSTEIRIFALMRLGMTDPTHIANFLNCSMPTIYNYRSRVKNKSLYSKEEFDERLMSC